MPPSPLPHTAITLNRVQKSCSSSRQPRKQAYFNPTERNNTRKNFSQWQCPSFFCRTKTFLMSTYSQRFGSAVSSYALYMWSGIGKVRLIVQHKEKNYFFYISQIRSFPAPRWSMMMATRWFCSQRRRSTCWTCSRMCLPPRHCQFMRCVVNLLNKGRGAFYFQKATSQNPLGVHRNSGEVLRQIAIPTGITQ